MKKNWGLGVSEVGDAESEEREKVGRVKIINYTKKEKNERCGND